MVIGRVGVNGARICCAVFKIALIRMKASATPDAYRGSDLDHVWLVVVATNDDELNRCVHRDAEERRIFCNVADVPDLCSFILPALHRRGSITVASAGPGQGTQFRVCLPSALSPQEPYHGCQTV